MQTLSESIDEMNRWIEDKIVDEHQPSMKNWCLEIASSPNLSDEQKKEIFKKTITLTFECFKK